LQIKICIISERFAKSEFMARRPRHPTPLEIRITHNPKTGLYEIIQEGITYCMPLELTRRLKQYYRIIDNTGQGVANMKMFYNDMSKDEKAQIIRKGISQQPGDNFFPDPEYD
jgi:hypothetical protein